MTHTAAQRLSSFGITACISKAFWDEASEVVGALHKKGVSCFLVNWRDGGEQALKELSASFHGALLGASGINNIQEARAAVAAGAEFLSARQPDMDLVEYAREGSIALLADCETEDDIRLAVCNGAELIRPLGCPEWEAFRGIPAYQAVKWVIPVTKSNHRSFRDGDVLSVSANLEEMERASIPETLEALLREMLCFTFDHLGINCTDSMEAQTAANTFESVFGFHCNDIGNSIFCGQAIEALKAPFVGKHGHLCIGTANVARAVRYLSQMGFTFLPGSEKYVDGTLLVIYMNEEIAGFGFHLLLKK